ncbi:FAD dependent oxidoreductase-domain-containing protein [Cyathus striatus]|nr:FAD dependent oxidoreductase-domain-containing protein [Cyathus striatus]
MGLRFSKLLNAYQAAQNFSTRLAYLIDKFSASPGLPVPNPTTPFWAHPLSPLAKHGAEDPLVEYADIVIIGSGITGTAIARTILDNYHPRSSEKPLTVVMLEARDTCSGATARNGGHITPWLYHDYLDLKDAYGSQMAQKVIRFRLSHVENLLSIAQEEKLVDESQCRRVDTYDVFFDKGLFNESKRKLAIYCKELPEESKPYRIIEDREEIQHLQLSPLVVGCIATTAGAVHPYRLVTGILARLLRQYSTRFHLYSNTPCTSVEQSSTPSMVRAPYVVKTARGDIRARHVVYATNGWTSHLLQGMRSKIVPARGDMTAQRPGQTLGKYVDIETGNEADWTGGRSFVFYPGDQQSRYDYLTQQPPSKAPTSGSGKHSLPCSGELMFGGGFLQGGSQERTFFESVGVSDDSSWNFSIASYLSGALGLYFEPGWGRERIEETEDVDGRKWGQGRLKAHWSGILGFSVDDQPWVGRVPAKIAGRNPKRTPTLYQASEGSVAEKASDDLDSILTEKTRKMSISFEPASGLAPEGEWIAAGYTGEGMPHAWMCGTALAHMILQTRKVPPLMPTQSEGLNVSASEDYSESASKAGVPAWLPEVFLITEERWKRADVGKWITNI